MQMCRKSLTMSTLIVALVFWFGVGVASATDECVASETKAVPNWCWLNGSMEGYLTNAEFVERMAGLAAQQPHLLSKGVEIGRTVNNASILAYRLGRRAQPSLLIVSMIYARDVSALATVLYAVEELCRRYAARNDSELVGALDSGSLVFVPVVNVDAFVDDARRHKHGGGDSVKNARPWTPPPPDDDDDAAFRAGGAAARQKTMPSDCQPGVNIDRNFPTFWAKQAHSRGACSVEYRGPTPASEPETQALVELVTKERPYAALLFHSLPGVQYQSQLMFPWFFIDAPVPLTDRERRHHERLAHAMKDDAADIGEFLIGPGAHSQFDGDGTLPDFLWGRGIYTLLLALGVSNTGSADSHYWPKRHAMAQAAINFFVPIRRWIIDCAAEAAADAPRGFVLQRWFTNDWRETSLQSLPAVLFVVTMGCLTMFLALVGIARWRASAARARTALALQNAPPATPIDEPATLAELGLIKNR